MEYGVAGKNMAKIHFHPENSHSGGADDRTIQIDGSHRYSTFGKLTHIRAVPFRFPMAGNWDPRRSFFSLLILEAPLRL
jgi:hypothetical protein